MRQYTGVRTAVMKRYSSRIETIWRQQVHQSECFYLDMVKLRHLQETLENTQTPENHRNALLTSIASGSHCESGSSFSLHYVIHMSSQRCCDIGGLVYVHHLMGNCRSCRFCWWKCWGHVGLFSPVLYELDSQGCHGFITSNSCRLPRQVALPSLSLGLRHRFCNHIFATLMGLHLPPPRVGAQLHYSVNLGRLVLARYQAGIGPTLARHLAIIKRWLGRAWQTPSSLSELAMHR